MLIQCGLPAKPNVPYLISRTHFYNLFIPHLYQFIKQLHILLKFVHVLLQHDVLLCSYPLFLVKPTHLSTQGFDICHVALWYSLYAWNLMHLAVAKQQCFLCHQCSAEEKVISSLPSSSSFTFTVKDDGYHCDAHPLSFSSTDIPPHTENITLTTFCWSSRKTRCRHGLTFGGSVLYIVLPILPSFVCISGAVHVESSVIIADAQWNPIDNDPSLSRLWLRRPITCIIGLRSASLPFHLQWCNSIPTYFRHLTRLVASRSWAYITSDIVWQEIAPGP